MNIKNVKGVLVKKLVLNLADKVIIVKFTSKYEGPYEVKEVCGQELGIWKNRNIQVVNGD